VFLAYSGISNFLLNFFGRPFTGGGEHAVKYKIAQQERIIAKKHIDFQKGLILVVSTIQ